MRTLFFLAALGLIAVVAHITPALAATCGPNPIEARGAESRFVWIAKAKARASWRARVRQTPGLGPAYANWSHADNTEERCLSGPAGTVCFFTGTPCLK